MKTLKKILAFILVGASLASSAVITAYADENHSDTTASENHAGIDEREYQEYLDSLSDEQLQLVREKEERVKEIEQQIVEKQFITLKSTTIYSIPGTFTMYQQETDTYCGPACVKSVLMYINGSSPSQSDINDYIGGKFTTIPRYMNSKQKQCNYLLKTNPTQSSLTAAIFSSIYVDKVPTFLRISGTTRSNWYYATSGHCILAYEIYSDYSKIKIADPLGDRVEGCPYFYLKPASTVAKYTTHVCY